MAVACGRAAVAAMGVVAGVLGWWPAWNPFGPEPVPYGTLTVEVEPLDATVTLPGTGLAYEPGMELLEGEYRVEVSRAGHREVVRTVMVAGDTNTQLLIELELNRQPFTVQVTPTGARVEWSILSRPMRRACCCLLGATVCA